jgi:glycosidase
MLEKENLKEISKLAHLRKNHSALRQGDFYTLLADVNCYAYIRSDMNERVLVVLNKSEEKQKVQLNIPPMYKLSEAVDLANGNAYEIIDNQLILGVPAIGWQLFKLN